MVVWAYKLRSRMERDSNSRSSPPDAIKHLLRNNLQRLDKLQRDLERVTRILDRQVTEAQQDLSQEA